MQFNKEDIDIGERLRSVRESMHMTREEFSEKIDITDSFLGQIERGERSLSAKTLKKVVKCIFFSFIYVILKVTLFLEVSLWKTIRSCPFSRIV